MQSRRLKSAFSTKGLFKTNEDPLQNKIQSLTRENIINELPNLPPSEELNSFLRNIILQYETDVDGYKLKLNNYLQISKERDAVEGQLMKSNDKVKRLQGALKKLQDLVYQERGKYLDLQAKYEHIRIKEDEKATQIRKLLRMTENTQLHNVFTTVFREPIPAQLAINIIGSGPREIQTIQIDDGAMSNIADALRPTPEEQAELIKRTVEETNDRIERERAFIDEKFIAAVKESEVALLEAQTQSREDKEKIATLARRLKATEDELGATNKDLLDLIKTSKRESVLRFIQSVPLEKNVRQVMENITANDTAEDILNRLSVAYENAAMMKEAIGEVAAADPEGDRLKHIAIGFLKSGVPYLSKGVQVDLMFDDSTKVKVTPFEPNFPRPKVSREVSDSKQKTLARLIKESIGRLDNLQRQEVACQATPSYTSVAVEAQELHPKLSSKSVQASEIQPRLPSQIKPKLSSKAVEVRPQLSSKLVQASTKQPKMTSRSMEAQPLMSSKSAQALGECPILSSKSVQALEERPILSSKSVQALEERPILSSKSVQVLEEALRSSKSDEQGLEILPELPSRFKPKLSSKAVEVQPKMSSKSVQALPIQPKLVSQGVEVQPKTGGKSVQVQRSKEQVIKLVADQSETMPRMPRGLFAHLRAKEPPQRNVSPRSSGTFSIASSGEKSPSVVDIISDEEEVVEEEPEIVEPEEEEVEVIQLDHFVQTLPKRLIPSVPVEATVGKKSKPTSSPRSDHKFKTVPQKTSKPVVKRPTLKYVTRGTQTMEVFMPDQKAKPGHLDDVTNTLLVSKKFRENNERGFVADFTHKSCNDVIKALEGHIENLMIQLEEIEKRFANHRETHHLCYESYMQLQQQLQDERDLREGIIEPYVNQNDRLNERVRALKRQLRRLEAYRRLEIEGFLTEIAQLRDKLTRFEIEITKSILLREGGDTLETVYLQTLRKATSHADDVNEELLRVKAKLNQVEGEIRRM